MTEEPAPQITAAAFVTTQWTRVLEAKGDSPEAKTVLSELCAAYYAPVFGFIRRSKPNEDTARDLTQGFFARLLERQGIEGVDPKQGRFRSYLLGAVKHFMADMRAHDRRQKRGAGYVHQPLEPATDTSPGLEIPDPNSPGPEREFDHRWALALLDRALNSLAAEYKSNGTANQFDILKPWLTGDMENLSQADAGRRLGLNEGAVKVAIHRLRRQFRHAIRREVAQTVKDNAQVDLEMKFLLEALL